MTSRTAASQASLSFTISQSLLKVTSTESVMPSNHLILHYPFSSYPQCFPALGSFPMSWLFASTRTPLFKILNYTLYPETDESQDGKFRKASQEPQDSINSNLSQIYQKQVSPLIYTYGEGNGNPLKYSCLGNPMHRGTWRAIVLGVPKSRTRLSN